MKVFLAVVGGIAAFTLLIIGLQWVGLFAGRPMAKYQVETEKQVYDDSRAGIQGVQHDIDVYCVKYHEADAGSKRAIADLIHSELATYSGPLSPTNQTCLSEIGQ